jgi:hypothetical protein
MNHACLFGTIMWLIIGYMRLLVLGRHNMMRNLTEGWAWIRWKAAVRSSDHMCHERRSSIDGTLSVSLTRTNYGGSIIRSTVNRLR